MKLGQWGAHGLGAAAVAACLASTLLLCTAIPRLALAEASGQDAPVTAMTAGAIVQAEDDGFAEGDEPDLSAGLKAGKGSALSITSPDASQWTVNESEEGRAYLEAVREQSGASISITSPNAGWLIWEWKLGNYEQKPWPRAKITLTTTGEERLYPHGDLESSVKENAEWKTGFAKIDAPGETITWTWTAEGSNSACIDNIRFVESLTEVSATADEGAEAMVLAGGEEVSEVEPGTTVTFRAQGKAGVVEGWKASADADEPVQTAAQFTQVVYDEPVSYYVYSSKPFEGSGTAEDPFLLGSRADLEVFGDYVSRDNTFAGKTFKLASDIDCSDKPLAPIGYVKSGSKKGFAGTFDGDGKRIAFSSDTGALFIQLDKEALVRNLELDASIRCDNTADLVGGLAGTCYGQIERVAVSGEVFAKSRGSQEGLGFGGLVGNLGSEAKVSSCSVSAHVHSGEEKYTIGPQIGGIAGKASYGVTISDCSVTGEVSGDGVGSRVGGILGYASSSGSSITGCTVSGAVSGAKNIGGIVGQLVGSASEGCRIADCVVTGAVSGSEDVGGIAGYSRCGKTAGSDGSGIANCRVEGDVSASGGRAGGIAAYAYDGGYYSGNQVLSQRITGTKAGRIAAESAAASWSTGGKPTFEDNWAFPDTLVNGAKVAATDKTAKADGLNGATMQLAEPPSAGAPFVRLPLIDLEQALRADAFEFSGTTSASEVGLYDAVAKPRRGFAWSDRSLESRPITWEIYRSRFSDATVDPIDDERYTGSPLEPRLQVELEGKQLVEGEDYEAVRENNVLPGRATVLLRGIGAYEGSATVVFFSIVESDAYRDDKRKADAVGEAIDGAPAAGELSLADADGVAGAARLREASAAYDALSEVQKAIVPADKVTRLEDALARLEVLERMHVLASALRKPGTQEPEVSAAGNWNALELQDGQSHVAVSGDWGTLSIQVPSGGGWLLFDWKIENASGSSAQLDFDLTRNGELPEGQSAEVNVFPWGGISGGSSSVASWSTAYVVVPEQACTATWTWADWAAGATGYIRNVRFVTERTPVAASGDGHVTVSVQAPYGEEKRAYVDVSEVSPGQGSVSTPAKDHPLDGQVIWSASGKDGYVFAGWKRNADDEEFCSTAAAMQLTVGDDPMSFYAVSRRPFSEGAGTQEDPYVLKGPADLADLDQCVNAGVSFAGYHFVLAGDIQVTDAFGGIGSAKASVSGIEFDGHLDGRGHAISGISNDLGLFYHLGKNALVENVNVSGTVVEGKDDKARGLVACLCDGELNNVTSSGSVASARGGAGGLVGELGPEARIVGCSSTAAVSVTYSSPTLPGAGGLAAAGAYDAVISDSAFFGTVSGSGVGSSIGGILGLASGRGIRLERCYVGSAVRVDGHNYVGGIVGRAENNIAVHDCEFSGHIATAPVISGGQKDYGDYAGGIVGGARVVNTSTDLEIERCMSAGSLDADGEDAGGIVGLVEGRGYRIRDNLCLMSGIDAHSNARRIAGKTEKYESGKELPLSGNYAWAGMLRNGEELDEGQGDDPNSGHGCDLSTSTLHMATETLGPCAAWGGDSGAWLLAPGKKPQLKSWASASGQDYPDYLRLDLSSCRAQAAPMAYTGEALEPEFAVSFLDDDGVEHQLMAGKDFQVDARGDNVNAGEGWVSLAGLGSFAGILRVPFAIVPAAHQIAAHAAGKVSMTYDAGRVRSFDLGKVLSVEGALGDVSYRKTAGNQGITVSASGNLAVRKGLAAGVYAVKLTLSDQGDANRTPASRDAAITVSVAKAPNPLKAKGKVAKLKWSKVKRAKQSLSIKKALGVSGAQGAVTYAKVSGNKAISVSSKGKIAVKKGTPRGTYAVKVKVKAKGTQNYKSKATTAIARIRIA